jgi:baculoviral IAP repeat-containing protein 7/8
MASRLSQVLAMMVAADDEDEALSHFVQYMWSTRINRAYSSLQDRVDSYRDYWPLQMVQDPKKLAEAGFYYTNKGDLCVCYYCGFGLRRWESHCDPWIEHARHFGDRCNFVRFHKGEPFIKEHFGKPPAAAAAPVATAAAVDAPTGNINGSASTTVQVVRNLSNKSDENDEPDDNNCNKCTQCKLCLSGEIEIIFIPCGHVLCCSSCALSLEKCPYCRQEISKGMRIHFT